MTYISGELGLMIENGRVDVGGDEWKIEYINWYIIIILSYYWIPYSLLFKVTLPLPLHWSSLIFLSILWLFGASIMI